MLVAGLMSGTSVDGIDVALVEISGEGFDQAIQPLAALSIPYPRDVREAILGISNSSTHTSRISQMNFLLGKLFGDAVVEACRRSDISLEKLELIGSHGRGALACWGSRCGLNSDACNRVIPKTRRSSHGL